MEFCVTIDIGFGVQVRCDKVHREKVASVLLLVAAVNILVLSHQDISQGPPDSKVPWLAVQSIVRLGVQSITVYNSLGWLHICSSFLVTLLCRPGGNRHAACPPRGN
jgi:hypothetical protein